MTENEFAELFNSAYGTAATIKNAVSGFRKSGIFPYNRAVFSDDDFVGAQATDKQLESQPSTSAVTNTDEPHLASAAASNLCDSTSTQALVQEAEVQSTPLESVDMSAVTSPGSSAQSSGKAVVVDMTQAQPVDMLTETRPGTLTQSLVEEADVQMTPGPGQAVESAETEPDSQKQSLIEAVEVEMMQAQSVEMLTETRRGTPKQSLVEETEVMTPVQAVEIAETKQGLSTQSSVETVAVEMTQGQLAETGPSMSTLTSLPSAVVTNASETDKLSFKQLIGIPVQQEQQKRIRKRKVGHACVITESPYKKMLVEAKEVKDKKEATKAQRIRNREEKKLQAEVKKKLKRSGNYVNIHLYIITVS